MDQDAIDSINAQLKQLALQAQAAPPDSVPRRTALAQLIGILQNYKFLYRLPRSQCPPQLMYQEVCDVAMQALFLYVCKNIDKYNPDYEITQWVNFLLKIRFFRVAIKELLSDLRELDPPPETPSLSEQIVEYVKRDPEQYLSEVHIRNHPEVTPQVLALRLLAGYKWREISAEFGIPIGTLCTFYKKHLKRCAASIRNYITQ